MKLNYNKILYEFMRQTIDNHLEPDGGLGKELYDRALVLVRNGDKPKAALDTVIANMIGELQEMLGKVNRA